MTRWIDATDESLLCLSVLILGEIRKGIALLPMRLAVPLWKHGLITKSFCVLRSAFWRLIRQSPKPELCKFRLLVEMVRAGKAMARLTVS